MNNKLSENLKRLRFQRGTLQKELACYLPCTVSTISNYENGVHMPDCDTLAQLADFYGVSIDYLFGRRYQVSFQNRAICGKYTLGQFLRLLDALPEKHLHLLVEFLSLLEETKDS